MYEAANIFTADQAMLYKPLGIIDVWESIQWLEYYQDVGEVLLVCPCTPYNQSLLLPGNLLRYQSQSTAVIVQAEVQDTAGNATLTIRAQTYATVLNERLGEHSCFLDTATALAAYLEQNHRHNGLARHVEIQSGLARRPLALETCWQPLLEVLQNACQSMKAGFASRLIASGQNIYNQLALYTGKDLSLPENYKGYLGGADDIDKLRIVNGVKDYKNIAIVAGKEENGQRYTIAVAAENILPQQRRELFVDAANLGRKYKTNVPTGEVDAFGYPLYRTIEKEYTASEYDGILQARGLQELARHLPLIEISAETDGTQSPLVFGTDYQLGDIVPMQLEEYGLRIKARVTGVKLVEEISAGSYRNVILSDFEVME